MRWYTGVTRTDWGSSDISSEDCFVHWSDRDSSMSEEEEDGRMGRISNHHDDEIIESDKAKETGRGSGAKGRMLKTEGASSSQNKQACESASKSGAQSQPTRCQPSRKAKKTVAAGTSGEKRSTSAVEKKRKDSSSVAGNCQPKPKKHETSNNSMRCQPKRKVKSAPASQSAATSCHDEAMNSEPLASSSSSSMVKPNKGGSGARAVANGNGETTSSGRGSRAIANGNGETTSGSGPSQRWTRKRNRREREANGTAANNYQQYRAEDFLKAKSPTSFYAKKKDPP